MPDLWERCTLCNGLLQGRKRVGLKKVSGDGAESVVELRDPNDEDLDAVVHSDCLREHGQRTEDPR